MDKNKWPIAKITFIALLCLQIVTVGLMMLISHLWGEEAYLKHVRGLMRAVATESVQSVENLLQPAEHLIKNSRGLMEAGVLPVTAGETMERYFFQQVSVNANFSGMYFGWINGDFLFTRHGEADELSPYVTKYVVKDKDVRKTQLVYRTAAFLERDRVDTPTDFDPRTRPWFKAVSDSGYRWTAPYVYFTSQRPGITVSSPVLNAAKEPIGVMGLDIEISNLSHFLSKNELSHNSTALIATRNKEMVAHTDFDTIMKPDPANPEKHMMISLADIDDELSKKSIAALEAEGKSFVSDDVRTVTLEFEGETYHAVFHSYNKLGLEWTVVVTAPESDFIEMIRSAQRWQILAAVISSLVITLIAFLLALRFLKPVDELQESVLRNPLTGLYNRRALDQFGDEMVKEEHAKGQPVSVAMIDIDRFKTINDTFGHPIGDEVLVVVSQRMLNVLKKSDILTRYGGEEFALLMIGADLASAHAVCERLRRVVSQSPVMTSSGNISVTVSIGVECIAQGDDYFRDALAAADKALYQAKRQGRDQVCTYSDLSSAETTSAA